MVNHPQRLAWITLLSGLTIFCLLCISTVIFTRWVLFESPTPLNVTINVGRATVSLAEPDTPGEQAIKSPAQVGRHNRLSTDNVSQGYLAFADSYSGEVIATVTLHSDSVVTLSNASRPRFSLSKNPYAIRLAGTNGRLEVWVRPDLDREIRLDIESEIGTIRIGEGGSYLVESNPSYLEVTSRSGTATLINREGVAQHITTASTAVIHQSSQIIVKEGGPIELLPNGTFDRVGDSNWPFNWTCAFEPSPEDINGPRGEFKFDVVDGRSVVHIWRLQPEAGPGDTGCQQVLAGPSGIDVLQYDTLNLRVSMMVNYQKLSGCGVQGSECPVMLRIKYLDLDGNPRTWYHGFYAEYTPNEGRTRCDTCLEEHERINKNAWYTYDSGNLLTNLPEGTRPGSIIEIRFYASGHQVDVLIDEVSLVATKRSPDSSSQAAGVNP